MSTETLRVRRSGALGVAVAGAGMAALALRPEAPGPTVLLAVVGSAAILAPLENPAVDRSDRPAWAAVVLLGVAAFATARLVGDPPALPISMGTVFGSALAAVCEEALFRRLLYDRLRRWSEGAAVAGAAVAFALVHLPLYGAASVPLNVAAGLLLGWQRWATGGWTAPAVTHVSANLLVLV